MPQSDFYNHNRFIAYPLKELAESLFPFGIHNLRESAILDVGFVLGIDTTFDPQYRVKLTQLTVAGALVTFRFQDEAATATFDFICDSTEPVGTLYEVDALEGPEFGSAFVVAGDLAVLVAEIATGTHLASEAFYVEEGTVQSLVNHYVKQFTIASQPDTPWHTLEECGGVTANIWKFTVTGRDLRGHRKFKPGFNAAIAVIELDNAIQISADIGAGEGEPCERVDLGSVSSLASLSSESLSSLILSSMSFSSISMELDPTRCKDVFNTINGVRPDALGNFVLTALSAGLTVITEPENHKVILEFRAGANAPFCVEE